MNAVAGATQSPSSPPPEGEPKPSADKPAVPGGVKATASGSVQSAPKPAGEASIASPAVPPKPAAAAPAAPPATRPVGPAKPPAPTPMPWDSPMIARLKGN